MSKNFFLLSNHYYALRENHYNSIEAMERYTHVLTFASQAKTIVNNKAIMVNEPYMFKNHMIFYYVDNPQPYTFYGYSPYYLSFKGDHQYIVDQMNFAKPALKMEWQFQTISPGLILIKGQLAPSKNRPSSFAYNCFNYQQVIYLRGVLKDERKNQ